MADPDVELTGVGGGGGLFLFALPAFPSSVIFFIFYPRKGGGPPGPSSRSATDFEPISARSIKRSIKHVVYTRRDA